MLSGSHDTGVTMRIRAKISILIFLATLLYNTSATAIDFEDILSSPAEIEIIGLIRPALIINDPLMSNHSQEADQIFSQMKKYGITPDQIESVLMLGSLESWTGTFNIAPNKDLPGKFVIGFKGFFNSQSIIDKILMQGWTEEYFSDDDEFIWWDKQPDYYMAPESGEAIAFFGNDIVMASSDISMLKKLIDPEKGSGISFGKQLRFSNLLTDFRSNSNLIFTFSYHSSQASRDMMAAGEVLMKSASEIAGFKGVGTLIENFGRIETVDVFLGRRSGNYEIEILLGMDEEKSASVMSGVFQMIFGMRNIAPPSDPVSGILEKIEFSREGKILRLELKMTFEEISGLSKMKMGSLSLPKN